jgi:hypothetical protein
MSTDLVQEPEAARRPPTVQLIVNGRKKTVTAFELSYEEVVALAFESPPAGENVLITVTYRHGPDPHHSGSLVAGESVEIKDHMVFNVRATDKS